MDDDQLVPLADSGEASGFDVVLRGYDRRQVDDYLDRVEAALNDADARHAEDAQRLAALEGRVTDLDAQREDAERRAAGLPTRSLVTGARRCSGSPTRSPPLSGLRRRRRPSASSPRPS
jgi:DivIVA domain-containing protein